MRIVWVARARGWHLYLYLKMELSKLRCGTKLTEVFLRAWGVQCVINFVSTYIHIYKYTFLSRICLYGIMLSVCISMFFFPPERAELRTSQGSRREIRLFASCFLKLRIFVAERSLHVKYINLQVLSIRLYTYEGVSTRSGCELINDER